MAALDLRSINDCPWVTVFPRSAELRLRRGVVGRCRAWSQGMPSLVLTANSGQTQMPPLP